MYMYGKRMKELVLVTFVSELNIKLDHEWERKQERLGRKQLWPKWGRRRVCPEGTCTGRGGEVQVTPWTRERG